MNDIEAAREILIDHYYDARPRPIKDDFYWKKHLVPMKPRNDLGLRLATFGLIWDIYFPVLEELQDVTRNTNG